MTYTRTTILLPFFILWSPLAIPTVHESFWEKAFCNHHRAQQMLFQSFEHHLQKIDSQAIGDTLATITDLEGFSFVDILGQEFTKNESGRYFYQNKEIVFILKPFNNNVIMSTWTGNTYYYIDLNPTLMAKQKREQNRADFLHEIGHMKKDHYCISVIHEIARATGGEELLATLGAKLKDRITRESEADQYAIEHLNTEDLFFMQDLWLQRALKEEQSHRILTPPGYLTHYALHTRALKEIQLRSASTTNTNNFFVI